MIALRPYQQDAVDAIYRWFDESTGNPLVVVPTGGGKSVIIAAFVRSIMEQWPGERVLILTHVKELITQNHAAMLRAWPTAPAGIYSAGLRRREADAPVLFGGIQSLHRKAREIGWADLILVDESHLIPRHGAGMYRRLIADLTSMNPKLKIVGFTATPMRTGEGRLDEGKDRMFDGIAYTCELAKLITDKYLSPIRAKATQHAINTADVHVRGGEFIESELQDAALEEGLVRASCAEIVERSVGRRSWLVFCCGIKHARAVEQELRDVHGITCATVFGSTPRDERDELLVAFRKGTPRAIVNVNVLTTGFDAPQVDLIVLLRPTLSPVLYVQMVGRGLRVADGKDDGCLVLDFGENFLRHGPIDDVKIKQPGEKGKEDSKPPLKVCGNEDCLAIVAIAAKVCPDCGFVFPEPERAKHEPRPDEEAQYVAGLVHKQPIETWTAKQVHYEVWHSKDPAKPPTLRVNYFCGFNRTVSEWVCFDHPFESFPHRNAMAWWMRRVVDDRNPCPLSVADALIAAQAGHVLRQPDRIKVDTRGQYPDLRDVMFDREPGEDDGPPPDRRVTKAVEEAAVDYTSIPF